MSLQLRHWETLSQEQIKERIGRALAENVNYYEQNVLGVPASHLDSLVFYQDAPFLKDAPFMSVLVHNPNHIGCHTLGSSESFFAGTQAIEREVIALCAEDILNGSPGGQDGYVASGGTEANIQAVWIYRNLFRQVHTAGQEQIAIITSADAHYSMQKAANLLNLAIYTVPVNQDDRRMAQEALEQVADQAVAEGIRYFIVVANMMTTMFGSVDDPHLYASVLKSRGLNYFIHVDGAYGGFFYPFSGPVEGLDFSNPEVSSVTLDAHKMVQAPYGTGIFLVRKGLMQYANTSEASYVEGEDSTLIGSRSGANAVAIWMILMKNGPYGWQEKIFILMKRTQWLCDQLNKGGIVYYRHLRSNIVTLSAAQVPEAIAHRYGLVPDNHHSPRWYKIVVMEHVTVEKLIPLIKDLVPGWR
jgi:glutamate/tyrosine decarboxylase-like PLP-dependent enzyme